MYSELFEGKFTKTLRWKNLTLFGKIYYFLSPSTYTERKIISVLNDAVWGRENLQIVDIGCGGGNENLLKYGQVIGLDVSIESVNNARGIYEQAFVADATKPLELANASFDVVYSSEVLGHIAMNDKDKFLSELRRLVKPEGIVVLSVEIDGKNWLTEFLLKKGLYKKLWIETWGHIGLESFEETISRLEKHFDISKSSICSTYIFSADILAILKDDFRIFKCFGNQWAIRVVNLLLSLPFYFSLLVFTKKQVNNVVFLLKSK